MKTHYKNTFFVNFFRDFNYICFIAIIFSFFGWLVENTARLISLGIVDNRFHILPFIPVYGLIAFAAYVFGDPNELSFCGHKIIKNNDKKSKIISNIIFIILCMALVFLGELVVGNTYDLLFGAKLWDYSSQIFHFTPYTSLLSTVGFGFGAFVIIKYIYNPLLRFIKSKVKEIDAKFFRYMYEVLLIDMVYMMISTSIHGKGPVYWSINVKNGWPWLATIEIAIIITFLVSLNIFLYGSLKYFNTKKNDVSKKSSKIRFAILIPGVNDAKAIEHLLVSLEESFYDKDKYDIYLMVENDKIKNICLNYPSVICQTKKINEKEEVNIINEIIQDISISNKRYDAYLVLAPNSIVDCNFLSRLSDGFLDGYEVVVGNCYNKNPNDSATSGASSLTLKLINYINDVNSSNNEKVFCNGYGLCVDAKIVNTMKKWPFEFSRGKFEIINNSKYEDIKVCYVRDAIIYDEQPNTMRDSIIQRTSWIKGFISNTKNKEYLSFAFVGGLLMSISYIAFMLINLILSAIQLFTGHNNLPFKYFLVSFIIYLIVVMFISFINLIFDKKNRYYSPKNIIYTAIYHPFFLFSYLFVLFKAIKERNN